MARSVKRSFNNRDEQPKQEGPQPANDDALLKPAQESVRAKQEASRQNLLHLQGLEIKHLEGERRWIEQERARDVSVFNTKEIGAINQRYDRLVHRMEL